MRHNDGLSIAWLPHVCPSHGCISRTSHSPGTAGIPQTAMEDHWPMHRSLSAESSPAGWPAGETCASPEALREAGSFSRARENSVRVQCPPSPQSPSHSRVAVAVQRPPSLPLPPTLLSTLLDQAGLARQIFVLEKSKHKHGDPVVAIS